MIWYLVGINILSFIIYGLDKYLAIKKSYRVSEYSLFILAIFGGGIGALFGMKIFHHKTRKILFWIANILSTIIWLLIIFG
jgi:uncharacterized membrane protein YsdA (DUF1294 family)